MTVPLGGLLKGRVRTRGEGVKVRAGGEVFVVCKKLNVEVFDLEAGLGFVGPGRGESGGGAA